MFAVKKIKIPIYQGFLVCIICDDDDQLKNYYAKNKKLEEHIKFENNLAEVRYSSVLHEKNNHWAVEALFLYKDLALVDAGTLSHESVHCADQVYRHIGAYHDKDNPEPYSYLVEWFANTIKKFLGNYKNSEKDSKTFFSLNKKNKK